MLLLRNQEEILRRLNTSGCEDPCYLKQNKNVDELAKFSNTLQDKETRLNTVSYKIIL